MIELIVFQNPVFRKSFKKRIKFLLGQAWVPIGIIGRDNRGRRYQILSKSVQAK